MKAILHFDGGCRPTNPGPAGGAWVLTDFDTGELLEEGSTYIGEATVNQAEFAGLIGGLDAATAHGVTDLLAIGDSKVIIHIMQGVYRAKKAHLVELGHEAMLAGADIPTIKYVWTNRDNNARADAIVGALLNSINMENPPLRTQPPL